MSATGIVRNNIASRSGSHEEIALNEILISSPQDEAAASKSGSQEETIEIVSSPQDEAGRDTAASENGSKEEKDEIVFFTISSQVKMTGNCQTCHQRQLLATIACSGLTDNCNDEITARQLFEKFHQAALKGDPNTARNVYRFYNDKHFLGLKISTDGGTALHIAVALHSSIFVQIVLDGMFKYQLKIKNGAGNTAFCVAAASGKLGHAQVMLRTYSAFLKIKGENDRLPIEMAALSSHKLMVEFLYDEMKRCGINEEVRTKLMVHTLIKTASSENVERFDQYKKLYRAALKDDWSTARDIFERHPHYITAKISDEWDTPLHIAAAAENSKFVLNLVDRMNSEDLTFQNKARNTAFSLVAASGKLEVAKAMLKKNSSLSLIRGENHLLPIIRAALSGHKQMVEFLYDETKNSYIHEEDRECMFNYLIKTGFYDIALDLLKEHPELVNFNQALYTLARTPIMSSTTANQNHQEGILRRCFNRLSVSNIFCHKKPDSQALELLKSLLEKVDFGASWVSKVIFVAAACGNIEFLKIVIREHPDLILKVNDDNHSIFHVAVLNRQKDIFKLIYEISPSFKKQILKRRDGNGNNILHLAGMLAPPDRLNTIPGVALQLQQELLWFEEVSKIVGPLDAEAENRQRQTPRALFTEKHIDLKEKGEKWMKQTANSCMIVSTLIATVVFAATFTVPGGIKEDTGSPNFLQEVSFIIFVISDAISLVSSSCSILSFLSILTSRYAKEDFRLVLPRKLVLGLSSLFLSIAAMMMVFCSTVFIIFKDGMIWVPILVSTIASLPVILFTEQQWRLLYEVANSTFKISSLSQKSELTLFSDDKRETMEYEKRND